MLNELPKPKTIVILPELSSGSEESSALRQKLRTLERMAELGSLQKLSPIPDVKTPEALYLGMRRAEAQMAQGPLTVAALGADPPERSTHFHVSVLTRQREGLALSGVLPNEDEERVLLASLKRLDTRTLTTVAGEALDHALVWEGLGDLLTLAPSDTKDRSFREALPQGDAEPLLRRFIDDSVNVLAELEMNQQRIEEGLPAFDVFWPWGQGTRASVPNLAIRRGAPAQVESDSLRLAGLTRLAGYKHGDRHWHRSGLNLDLGGLAKRALTAPDLIIFSTVAGDLRQKGMLEELEWFAYQLDELLFAPLFDLTLRGTRSIHLFAPSQLNEGLALSFSNGQHNSNSIPFDERALEERSVPTVDLEVLVDRSIQG